MTSNLYRDLFRFRKHLHDLQVFIIMEIYCDISRKETYV